jgi:FkbM family methyltransferase
VRLWRWWCAHGLQSSSGGTRGGSFLMRRLRDLYSVLSIDGTTRGYLHLHDAGDVYVDVLDLHTYQMVVPQIERGDPELLLAKALTPPGGLFVDVGANIGILSVLALSGTAATVHSFEPNPAMMSRLCRTHSASRFGDRWSLHDSAVGASTGRSKLYVDDRFSGTASLHKVWQSGGKRSVDVPVVTVDHWREGDRVACVDVLKMDVEGWELEVLLGAMRTLRTCKPFVWFEHNLPGLQRVGHSPQRILDRLQDLGYEHFHDIGRLPVGHPLTRRELDSFANRRINLLAVPDERRSDFELRVKPTMHHLKERERA